MLEILWWLCRLGILLTIGLPFILIAIYLFFVTIYNITYIIGVFINELVKRFSKRNL